MNWFQNLSVRLKILSVATLGMLLFLVYAAYSFYIAAANISHLQKIESQDFPVLELVNANNVDFITISESFIAATSQADPDLLDEATSRAAGLRQRLRQMAATDPALALTVEGLQDIFARYIDAATTLTLGLIDDSLSGTQLQQQIDRVRNLQHDYQQAQQDFEQQRYEAFRGAIAATQQDNLSTQRFGLLMGLLALVLLATVALRVTRAITRPLEGAVDAADNIANGQWDTPIEGGGRDETGKLLRAIRVMRDALRDRQQEDQQQKKEKNHLAELNEKLRGELTLEQLGGNMLSYLVPVLEAQVGVFYSADNEQRSLTLCSAYALQRRKQLNNEVRFGESLVGQCALERQSIVLERVPEDYLPIGSGTGVAGSASVVVLPVLHEEELKGVLEIGSFAPFDDAQIRFLEHCASTIAIALHSAQNRLRLAGMLEQTREQAAALERQKVEMTQVNDDLEEQAMELAASESRLQQQQEELKAINEELEEQTQALRASEESLQAQQEELRVTNEELEAQTRLLTEQKAQMSAKNTELERLGAELEEKLRELEMSSRYKSEFLSTMSHELRTPLNSILILSNALAQNKKGNLDEKQEEHARVIHSAGSDLLNLINDILDISKIEEGKMELVVDALSPQEIGEHFQRHFAHVAESRGLGFQVELKESLPPHIFTDRQRLEQIIKNLLSNALKFTEHGSVTLAIGQPADLPGQLPSILNGEDVMCFSVIDTGVGIPLQKQKLIFEAFQQADGTTSRKYGGTGLGLTISKELARLLGGEISLHSDGEGQGATFTLYLPVGAMSAQTDGATQTEGHGVPRLALVTDASVEQETVATQYVVREKAVLIVEDDQPFAQLLNELAAEYGLEGHIANDGESALNYARQYRPSAIILDVGLPGMDGWEVMEKLKADPRTQDIPVHFLSGKNERSKGMELGAIDFLTKPVNQDEIVSVFEKIEAAIETNVRRLLVVEDSEAQHRGIEELFGQDGVEITAVTTGGAAIAALEKTVYDCMILDLTLPDMSGFELLETLHQADQHDNLPVVIYTGKDLTRDEEAKLRRYADRIILKTDRSHERLLNEASLFLHWLESNLPSHKRDQRSSVEHRDDVFEGKQLLLVDDDMRNIYALSAQLEELGFDITLANNGREALEELDENPQLDIVLMDIMMPEMDGYEAMTEIRKQSRFAQLPILALTAKAMKEDRAKCLEAGANDYCSKPIDMDKLTSLLRVWLHK